MRSATTAAATGLVAVLAAPAIAQDAAEDAAEDAAAEEVQRGGTVVVQLKSEQRILNPALRASTGVYGISGKIWSR